MGIYLKGFDRLLGPKEKNMAYLRKTGTGVLSLRDALSLLPGASLPFYFCLLSPCWGWRGGVVPMAHMAENMAGHSFQAPYLGPSHPREISLSASVLALTPGEKMLWAQLGAVDQLD